MFFKNKNLKKKLIFGVKLIVKGGLKKLFIKSGSLVPKRKENRIYVIGHISHTVQISDCDCLEENFISKLFAEE